jgi:hypothetical protein
MGYSLTVARIDFGGLLKIPGSRNQTLLRQVEDAVREQDAEFEEELDEWLVTPSQALQQIFDGTIPTEEDDVPAAPYVAALLPLYEHLGAVVGQINFSSNEVQLIGQWDAALAAIGYPEAFTELSTRGAPFPFPFVEPFPTIGFLTPEEVAACFEKNRGNTPPPRMDPPTFAMLCDWITEAQGRGEGLVGVLM